MEKEEILQLEWRRKLLRDQKTHIRVDPTDDDEGQKVVEWMYSYICRFDDSLADEAFFCIADKRFSSYEDALKEAVETCEKN